MELVVIRGPNVLFEPRGAVEAAELIEALREILGSYAIASPPAGRYLMRTLDLFARHVSDPDELWRALDEHAVWAGGHGFGEACALLLDASDSIRAALDRIDATNDPQGGSDA
jgi:hypothetical protein